MWPKELSAKPSANARPPEMPMKQREPGEHSPSAEEPVPGPPSTRFRSSGRRASTRRSKVPGRPNNGTPEYPTTLSMMGYNNGGAEFILEPVSPPVVKVTHRDQTGQIGINADWDALIPYSPTTLESQLKDDGAAGQLQGLGALRECSRRRAGNSSPTRARRNRSG